MTYSSFPNFKARGRVIFTEQGNFFPPFAEGWNPQELVWHADCPRDGGLALNALAGLATTHTMKLFAPRSAPAAEVAPDEPDFPLQVADPSVRPMHRQCVLNGCSYRSRFLFAAGWMLAACFLVASIAIAFYGVSSQEGLLRENALLIEALHDRGGLRTETPLQGKPSEPAPVAGAGIESSEPLKAPSPSTKINPRPRRPPERPQKPLEYTVPEEEKWWNRP